MKYLIIGLGVFGTNLAIDLTDIGHEVVAVDSRPEAVDKIKDIVATSYILDTSREESMLLLPLSNIDIIIVTIGNNFGDSIKTVALLKKTGVKRLMVRATDDLHEAILQGMGVDRILRPEKKSALNLVNELALNTRVESFNVNRDHYIFKFEVTENIVGRNYASISPTDFFNLEIIAATRPVNAKNILGVQSVSHPLIDIKKPDAIVESGDIVTVFGSLADFRKFNKDLAE